MRNLQEGDYFLIVESTEPSNFTVRLNQLERTIPVPVGGNDTCATAVEVPAGGGLFTGDTLGMINNYEAVCGNNARSSDAVFRVVLDERMVVTAKLEASFDTVLSRYPDFGAGIDSCNVLAPREHCNDDGGNGNRNSLLTSTLEPGAYYYVVDGFNNDNAGRYLFDIEIAPPP